MSDQKNNRNKLLQLRLTAEEYSKLQAGFSVSTSRRLTNYARSILLEKPVTIYTRNRSFDDFVAEMILLRGELKAIGNNFSQAVKKLHTLEQETEKESWAQFNESGLRQFFEKVDQINLKISQLAADGSKDQYR